MGGVAISVATPPRFFAVKFRRKISVAKPRPSFLR